MSKAEEIATTLARTLTNSDPGLHIQTCSRAIDYLRALDASHQRLKEALDWCVAEINRDSPSVINGRAALEQAKDLE